MPFQLRVHEPQRNGDNQVVGVKTTPYVRMSNAGEIVQIQSGEFYGGGGSPIADSKVPGWVWDQIDIMSPHVKRELKIESLKRP
jgi:hypothetical protein